MNIKSHLNPSFLIVGICTLLITCLTDGNLKAQSFSKLPTLPGVSNIDNRAMVSMDIDNNSWPDLIFPTRRNGTSHLFFNYKGSFTKASSTHVINASTANIAMITVGDFNNDCNLDLFSANGGGGIDGTTVANQLFQANGMGAFSSANSSGTTSRTRYTNGAVWVDFDEDGDLDLYVYNTINQKNEYYQNSGSSNFTEVDTLGFTKELGKSHHATFCDYDNDGDLDLFEAVGGLNNNLFRNDDTIFTKISSGSLVSDGGSSFSSGWGDYDNDGDFDLYVTNSSNQKNFLYENNGNATFTKITSGSAVSSTGITTCSVWFDFDNDGDLDLLTVNNGVNRLHKNDGAGNFTSANAGKLTSDNEKSVSAGVVDLNRDGYEDIVVSTRNGAPSIYMNTDSGNSYLNVNLLGTQGKASAINAEVRAKADISGNGSQWIYRQVHNSTGKNTQSSRKVHFGLGSATKVDSLVIKWVDGTRCTFTNVAVNGFFNVKPSGCKMDTILHTHISDSTAFLTAHFNSDSSKGDITSYHWDFGDGDTSNLKNPKHRYQNAGTYTVCLTTQDSYCKWDSVCTTVDICPDTSRIGFDYQSLNLNTTFTDTSISRAHRFFWDFGDGDTAVGKTVTHPYPASGYYQVCLTATDSCRSKTFCDSIFVCDTLIPGFGYTSQGFQISFTDSSNTNNVKYLFGDGNSDTARNPTHTYAQGGVYTVCQIASDFCGSDTLCQTIRVCMDTTQSAFTTTINANLVNFNSGPSQNASQFFWDFGDGNTSVQPNPSHIYAANGTFTACLVVINDCFSDTSCQTINVCPYNPGQANFSAGKLAIPNAVKFTDLSVNATSYSWDFGDGGSSTNKNPTHVFPREDDYNVCLTIIDSCGNSDSTCQIVNPATVGIEELALQDWKIYPNPVNDHLHVETADRYESLTVQIVSIAGQRVREHTFTQVERQEPLTLSLRHLPKGAYIVRFTANGEALPLQRMFLKN